MSQHDVFICFSSKDETVARGVVQFLEARAIKCWISARDVEPGQNYQESIVQALESAKIIVFLFSEHSNQSGEIKKELSLGASCNIAVIPLRLSNISPSGALRYELATRQWIDLFPDREPALGRLIERINDILQRPAAAEDAASESIQLAKGSALDIPCA
jgi:TIR domain